MNDFVISNSQVSGAYFGVLYGSAGTGKTWLCRHAENPFYIATEKGVEKVPDVGRFIKDGRINVPHDIDTFFNMMRFFITQQHDYKTIVIDSGKFVDQLIFSDVIAKHPYETIKKESVKVESIGDYNFGAGYDKALGYWVRILKGIEALNKKGINVILIAHAHDKNVSNVSGDYKKTKIDLFEFGQFSAPNLLYAASDWTYYLASEVQTVKRKNVFGTEKITALQGNPDIKVYTRSTNNFDAKIRTSVRSNVPDYYEIDMDDDATSKQIFIDLLK